MRSEYTKDDLVRVAGRWNNPKRSYLLVDPLQAKHIPCDPGEARAMMSELGRRAAAAVPGCGLVIGFAETATAIGAVVASAMGGDCAYRHSTREPMGPGTAYLPFEESHSHAVDQKLVLAGLEDDLARTGSVVFVDDELTTGRTLRRVVGLMREHVPGMDGKRVAVASVIDRVSGEDAALMAADGISRVSLLTDIGMDPEAAAAAHLVSDPDRPAPDGSGKDLDVRALDGIPDPRRGVRIGEYDRACARAGTRVRDWAKAALPDGARIRVVGTEECMYPAIAVGAALEDMGFRVLCHSTTRSPIGTCGDPGYPVRSSVSMGSAYDGDRKTYLYCLEPMDAAIVVTDAPAGGPFRGLAGALPEELVVFFSAAGGEVL